MMSYNKKDLSKAYKTLDKKIINAASSVVTDTVNEKANSFLAFDEVDVVPFSEAFEGRIVVSGNDIEAKFGANVSPETATLVESQQLLDTMQDKLESRLRSVLL